MKTARAFGLPIVHSTVNVASGQQQPTVPELAELLEDSPPLDRTTVNSWEDTEFVRATARPRDRAPEARLLRLWTEVCMAFAALDALREGCEIYPVVDAIALVEERPRFACDDWFVPMRDHPPVEHRDPMVPRLPRSAPTLVEGG